MKTEFVDLTDTKKSLAVEIPSEIVDAQIARVARSYSRAARIPGFRPGKVPPDLVKKRFRDKILHEVAHELIAKAIDDALRERGLEPVDTPDVTDVTVDEGRPLTFTAIFETLPPIDPGPYDTITVKRPAAVLEADAVDRALSQLRLQAARYEPVEERGIEIGDTVTLDLERRAAATAKADRHEDVSIDIGAPANPPGFDAELFGLTVGTKKGFTVTHPADYPITEMAGTEVHYAVMVKRIQKRVLPELDDEFAKDVGDFETLEALRERIRQDLLQNVGAAADRQVRSELLRALAARVTVDVPEPLVERELDRRVEEFARRLVEQQVDPRRTNIDWEAFRENQREASRDAVKSALVLDEVARREQLVVTDEDIERDMTAYAERSGRTPAAVRAGLEKEGALARLAAGLRREKAMDFLLARAQVIQE